MLPHTSTIMMRRNSAMERASKTNNVMTASSSSGSIGQHHQQHHHHNSHLHQSPILTSIENQIAPKHVQISPVIPVANRRQR